MGYSFGTMHICFEQHCSKLAMTTMIRRQSTREIKEMIELAQPINGDLVQTHILAASVSTVGCLRLKLREYYYKGGISRELLCLAGTVKCQYRGSQYNIPIEIWVQPDHPKTAPIAYVKPTPEMYISFDCKHVLRDGTIKIAYLTHWDRTISSIEGLLQAMSQVFSQQPPVYSTGNVTIHPIQYKPAATNTASPTFHNLTTSAASNSDIHQRNNSHRFSDILAEPKRMLLPIQGYEKMPIVSLEEAVQPLISSVPQVEQMAWIAKQNCLNPQHGLTADESAAIMIYTMEWEPNESSFYLILNRTLRSPNRDQLKPWFLYLRLIINALGKLPTTQQNVYRGVKLDLSDQYKKDSTVVWWGFSSCTSSIEKLENEQFLGKTGERTFFSIECKSGKSIQSHSYYETEDEVLLFPARQFRVTGCLDQGNGLHHITLKEIDPPFDLLKLPTI
ncbi:unnamed protein product [Adineta ricciae]|uniref:NAD(P)(+)--arginine ADP-ribosyltransferase n=2 Tax=Adineta ricciae TaxID=249248 RepID=A0A815IBQ4_ADIRI|nr:unnamed protein product [Adineta ricciae]